MDDYTLHSVMATSLCMGWSADAPDFDKLRGKKLLERYLALRRLFVGAWYPLTGCSRDETGWIASQYHRPDLNEGVVLAFRRAESKYRAIDASLRGLDKDAMYELTYESTGRKETVSGSKLMTNYPLTIAVPHSSELVVYKRVK